MVRTRIPFGSTSGRVGVFAARSGLAGLVLLLALPSLVWGQTPPSPVYFVFTDDAVTGDNTPVQFTVNKVNCSAPPGCYLPDLLDASGTGAADSYSNDVYERPTGLGPGSAQEEYYGNIDIVRSAVGYDDDFLYYQFELYDGPLDEKYGFEINFDADNRGDLFVEVDNPADKVAGVWASDHVTAYLDSDNSIGGSNPTAPDGPGVINGYEDQIFTNGNNQYPGDPGGNDAIRARIPPGQTRFVEVAVERALFEAINGGPVEKAAFRPLASRIPFNEGDYYIHDNDAREKIGSPYPWLTSPGAPASCPTTSDASLTPTQVAALESGSPTPTAYINPCFPNFQLREIDIGGTAQDLSVPIFQFSVDLGVTKAADLDSVSVGDPLTYTLTVSNVTPGTGIATGITVTDTLPTGLSFVSVTPSQGTCATQAVTVGGLPTTVVECELGQMNNGSSSTIDVVANGAVLGPVTNRAWVDVNEADTNNLNDEDQAAGVVVYLGDTDVIADGVDTLPRVPTNRDTNPNTGLYRYGFEINHTYSADKTLQLFAWATEGTAVVTIDSIRGPAVTGGPDPDMATLTTRPRVAADSAYVWFSVEMSDAPLLGDSIYLRASVAAEPSQDTGYVHVRIVKPEVDIVKSATPTTGIVPTSEITYTITFSNAGNASAGSVMVQDSLPDELYYKLGSETASLPGGITATMDFSIDEGGTWGAYTPVSEGCGAPAGFDGCVTHIRWTLSTVLPGAVSAPGNGGFVTFITRVR